MLLYQPVKKGRVIAVAILAFVVLLFLAYTTVVPRNNKPMKGFVGNIEEITLANTDFRRVLYTAKNSQLVVMSIPPGEEIGLETHHLDQFLRIEQGSGKAILDGVEHDVKDAWAIVVPAGTAHNFINTGDVDLRLYSIYSPPEHKDGTVHATKAEAVEEHFDGVTTE